MQNLFDKEYLVESILDHCTDIITIKDLNLNYVFYNKAFLRLLNCGNDYKVLGKSVYELFAPDHADILYQNMKKTIDTGEVQRSTYKLNLDNKIIIINQINTPIIRKGVMEGVLTISLDMTKEENLKARLFEKNNQLMTLLNNLPVLAYMKDKNLEVSIASEKAKEFLSNGIDYFSDGLVLDIGHISNETFNEDKLVSQSKRSLVKEKSAPDFNNKQHWYKVYKVPLLNSENEFDGLVTIAKNIDKEIEVENQRNLFLASISHDLKNPLQAQISSLELFYKGAFGNLTDTQKEMLEMIIESSKYMRTMLYTLLKTSKEQNGVIKLDRSYFSLKILMKKCIKEVFDLASSKLVSIKFESEVSEKDSIIYADEMQMRRVISNFLNNAVNYAFENTMLNVQLEQKDGKLFVSFENESEIISDELANCIFDKYVCGNSLTSNIGIGLGLYFCMKVVDAEQGNVALKRDGNKNTFIIELPILNEEYAFITELVL